MAESRARYSSTQLEQDQRVSKYGRALEIQTSAEENEENLNA